MEGDNRAVSNGNEHEEQICRDYTRGVCTRGDKCKFAHPAGMGSVPKNQPIICRDFQNGTCHRTTCKYLHVSNHEEKEFLRSGQLPSGARGGGAMHGRDIQACKDFLNNKCNRGNNCKFRHIANEGNMYGGGGGGGGVGAAGGGGGGGGYYEEPPRKRPRDAMDSDYRYLMEENVSLRRKVGDLQKEVADLRATNDILLEQNARYRRVGAAGSSSYGGGYAADTYASTRSSISYPSRDLYPPSGSYSLYPAHKPPVHSGYDGYTKFE